MDIKKVDVSGSVSGYDDTASAYSVEHGPPAYQFKRPEAPSVKIARLVAGTIVVVTLLAGMFYLLGTYIDARTSCRHLATSSKDHLHHPFPQSLESSPVAEARIDPAESKSLHPNLVTSSDDVQEDSSPEDGRPESEDGTFRFPLTLSMEDIGAMMQRNEKAQVNCLVEKKKAEEIVTENPKHLETPFGNLSTDPRYVHFSGETVLMSCRTGNQHADNERGHNNNQEPMGMHPFHNAPMGINHLQSGPMGMNHFPHGPMGMPAIHVIPLSASGRLMNGHPMMGPHPMMPFPMPSHHDMIPHPPHHLPSMHRGGPAIPLPMMPHHHPEHPERHEEGGPLPFMMPHPHPEHPSHHDEDGLLPLLMPMHIGMISDLQPRSTEFEEDEGERRKKRSLASCSCACR